LRQGRWSPSPPGRTTWFRQNRGARSLRPLYRASDSRRKDSTFAGLAARAIGSGRRGFDQQCGGCDQLRDAGTRPSAPRIDYDLVRNHTIVVRRAKAKEKIKTLDGIERELEPTICMISDGDGSRVVGIGGIMGGGETEISFSTKNVLIECAWFEPVAIRRATRF